MDVFFETQDDHKFSIEVGYWDTVSEIKKKIEKYQGIPVSKQTLFFNGEVPLEDHRNVEQCKIFHNSRLQLFVSPYKNDQAVFQTEQSSPGTSNSVGDIIYGQDLPLKTEHFINNQAFSPEETEQSPPSSLTRESTNGQESPVMVRSNNNDDQLIQTEESSPSNSAKEGINIQVSNNDQVLQIEKSSPCNSQEQIFKGPDSPTTISDNTIEDPIWKPVEVKMIPLRMTVFVLPYSGEVKIPVEVKTRDKVKEIRKELVKYQERGELNLPQEGYFFKHRQKEMVEDETFWNSISPSDNTIEICTQRGS